MKYKEYRFYIEPVDSAAEILIARLGELGFESFIEEDQMVLAYIPSQSLSKDVESCLHSDELKRLYKKFESTEISDQNWNALWESQYEPVFIDNRCFIRAPFHEPVVDAEYDVIIMPKMSFGTAHHETTHQMIRYLINTDVKNKVVLDMGCGTSVLAILAFKKGAATVLAVDNDEWAYNNSVENVKSNNCPGIKVLLGDASVLKKRKFDIILANINRNILLNDIKSYANCLNKEGLLFMSGFYQQDLGLINEACNKNGLVYVSNTEKNNWVASKYQKI